ncbi:hypothetical protein TNCV_4325181 [Trichonephila clavipes]|nr:hypothetical protein TNCV_4325181 [Trichonephila clavipes]
MIPSAHKAHHSQFFWMYRCFDIHLWIRFTPNAAVLFVDVAIQLEVRFIAKQNSLMKIGNNGNLVLGPFDDNLKALFKREPIHDELPNQTENKSLDSC